MRNIIAILGMLFLSVVFIQCKNDKEQGETEKIGADKETPQESQLNLTFLLDLSDRIEPSKYPNSPEHFERDQYIISNIVDVFKSHMNKQGGYKAKSKMKVIISPQPQDQNINDIVSKLQIDLSRMKPAEKKEVFNDVEQIYSENIAKIYDLSISQKNYIGSDIWRFFKNDIDYAITNDDNYRNILIIITDGYMYHENSKIIDKNRISYLLPSVIRASGLQGNNWKQKFEQGDYGIISERNNLEKLEVLTLEINPNPLNDEDVIKAYWSKWFEEMGIKKYEIYNSDLPTNTRYRIENFLNTNM